MDEGTSDAPEDAAERWRLLESSDVEEQISGLVDLSREYWEILNGLCELRALDGNGRAADAAVDRSPGLSTFRMLVERLMEQWEDHETPLFMTAADPEQHDELMITLFEGLMGAGTDVPIIWVDLEPS